MDVVPIQPRASIPELVADAASYVTLLEATRAVTNARKMTVGLYLLQRTFLLEDVTTTALQLLTMNEHVYSPTISNETAALWQAVKRGWVLPVRSAKRRPGRFVAARWTITPAGMRAVEGAFAEDRVRQGTLTSAWDEEHASVGR